MTKLPNTALILIAGIMLSAAAPLSPRAAAAPPAAAAASGQRLYQARCGSCHSIAANRSGPAHRSVFGRAAGMAPAYNYSPALRSSRIVWNAATLDTWLQGPQKMVKGTRMFMVVSNPAERAAIIAYLRTESPR